MKTLFTILALSISTISPAFAHGGFHGGGGYHGGGYRGGWVAPLVIGGAIGYAVTRPTYYAPPPPVYYADPYRQPQTCVQVEVRDEYNRFIRSEVRCNQPQ